MINPRRNPDEAADRMPEESPGYRLAMECGQLVGETSERPPTVPEAVRVMLLRIALRGNDETLQRAQRLAAYHGHEQPQDLCEQYGPWGDHVTPDGLQLPGRDFAKAILVMAELYETWDQLGVRSRILLTEINSPLGGLYTWTTR